MKMAGNDTTNRCSIGVQSMVSWFSRLACYLYQIVPPGEKSPRTFVKISFVAVILCSLTAKTAIGVLTLHTGDVTVEMKQSASWTVWRLIKADSPMINYWGLSSAQGTVLRIDGQWAGSAHGNEEVLSARVFVDGIEQPVADGLSYSGQVIKFVRNTILGQAYRLTSIMTIKQEYTNEYVIMQGLDPNKICSVFYGFLGTRDYPLSQYAAYDNNGVMLYTVNFRTFLVNHDKL
jgi:hypothetical protein